MIHICQTQIITASISISFRLRNITSYWWSNWAYPWNENIKETIIMCCSGEMYGWCQYNCNWINRIYLYSQKNRIKERFAALGLKNRNFDIGNFDF